MAVTRVEAEKGMMALQGWQLDEQKLAFVYGLLSDSQDPRKQASAKQVAILKPWISFFLMKKKNSIFCFNHNAFTNNDSNTFSFHIQSI